MTVKEKAALLSVCSNTLLVVMKISVGLFTGVKSVFSEGIHSSVDLIASALQYVAIKKSGAPPDGEHRYGHGKIENVSAGTESLLIIMAGFMIAADAIETVNAGNTPEDIGLGLVIMAISIVVNFVVSSYMLKVAKETASQALEADAIHLRADIWTSVGVLAGLVLIKITGYMWLDAVIALFVALVIIRAGVKLAKKAFLDLTDSSLPKEDLKIITDIISVMPEVKGFHAMRTRKSGEKKMLDVHILFDGNMHLARVHAVCDDIEEQLKKAGFSALDVLIHPEPYKDKPMPEGFVNIKELLK